MRSFEQDIYNWRQEYRAIGEVFSSTVVPYEGFMRSVSGLNFPAVRTKSDRSNSKEVP
jgi:hypothetical protein